MRERLGMEIEVCRDGWGWIQSLRGWMGMGTKVRPRAGLYCIVCFCSSPTVLKATKTAIYLLEMPPSLLF